jgi:putative hydrolase of the HAD superfamily
MNNKPSAIKALPINQSPLPKVIFLDAVGTLFGVKGSVGEVYSAIASNWGVEAAAADLNRAFIASFKASPPSIFPEISQQKLELQDAEFKWWMNIARNTFAQVGAIDQFVNFHGFFAELYEHFATDASWYLYEDVIPTLNNWQNKGVELGIVSNFDTRLDRVLKSLNLKPFFQSITISSVAGTAKPDSQIFMLALAKHNCEPHQAWHIGDSLTEDYYGAKAVGIESFWLNRA